MTFFDDWSIMILRMSELVDKYKKEFDEDCDVDRLTLMSKLETGALCYNKWGYRHYQHKTILAKLEERKADLSVDQHTFLDESNDTKHKSMKSIASKEHFIKNTEVVRDINKLISAEERVVEYLASILTNCQWVFSKNLANMVNLIKIEELS